MARKLAKEALTIVFQGVVLYLGMRFGLLALLRLFGL